MPFDLSIVTPQGEAYRGPVESVVLPGSEGDFGVLPRHERFLTALRVGAIRIETGSDTLWAAVAAGFADVTGDAVVVLVESCELAHEIDTVQAQLAKEQAEQGLREHGDDPDDARIARFEAAIEHAQTRLSVSERQS